jgi:hypothetical protein
MVGSTRTRGLTGAGASAARPGATLGAEGGASAGGRGAATPFGAGDAGAAGNTADAGFEVAVGDGYRRVALPGQRHSGLQGDVAQADHEPEAAVSKLALKN